MQSNNCSSGMLCFARSGCFGSLLMCAVCMQFVHRTAHSQSEPPLSAANATLSSKTLSWQDAVGLIDSEDAAEVELAEGILRESLRTSARTEEMACGLILICMKRQDITAAIKAITGIRRVFSNPNAETQSFVTRSQLWVLLAHSDPEMARKSTAPFRELVLKTCRDKTLSPVTLRANAMAIGVTCGMLRSPSSGKWIVEKDLDIAEKCMLESQTIEISSTFKSRLGEAMDRAALVEATIERIRQVDPAVVASEQTVREERLADLRAGFDSVKEGSLAIIRNAREAAKQSTSERRKLADLLRGLEREWKLVTPGHPGSPPRAPKEPQRSDVNVDEYEWRMEYETVRDADGNTSRQLTRKRVRRDSGDVRREEDFEYRQLQDRYRNDKAEYDSKREQYSQLLTEWKQRDLVRRTNLKSQQMAALARREVLEQIEEARKEEQSAAAAELTDQSSELRKLTEEFELIQLALETIEQKTTTIAFQPPHFKVIDFEAEFLALQNRVRAAK